MRFVRTLPEHNWNITAYTWHSAPLIKLILWSFFSTWNNLKV